MKFKIVKQVDWRYYDLNGRLTREECRYYIKRNGLLSRFYLRAYLQLCGNIVHGGTIMFTSQLLASRFYNREEAERCVKSLKDFPEKFEIMK